MGFRKQHAGLLHSCPYRLPGYAVSPEGIYEADLDQVEEAEIPAAILFEIASEDGFPLDTDPVGGRPVPANPPGYAAGLDARKPRHLRDAVDPSPDIPVSGLHFAPPTVVCDTGAGFARLSDIRTWKHFRTTTQPLHVEVMYKKQGYQLIHSVRSATAGFTQSTQLASIDTIHQISLYKMVGHYFRRTSRKDLLLQS